MYARLKGYITALPDRYRLNRWIGGALAILIVSLSAATYFSFRVEGGIQAETGGIFAILIADIIVLLLLSGLVLVKLVRLWLRHKKGIAGSKLHYRLTLLFSLIAVTPAIIMMFFSALFFHYGVQSWFSDEIKTSLNKSLSVAKSYLAEHQQVIGRDARLMAADLNKNKEILDHPQTQINEYLTLMSTVRGLKEAIVFDEEHNILGRSDLTIALEFEVVPQDAVQQAESGNVALLTSAYHDRVRALVRLEGSPGRYLYVGRFVDPQVLKHLVESEGVVQNYNTLALAHLHVEITFVLVFVVIALLILLASIWFGLLLADKLVHPIDELIQAAEKMRKGDLSIRVPETEKNDELSSLKRSFNRLASQIESQQQALLFANQELNERRRFIESILASVSSGVISLNDEGILKLSNLAASKLLMVNLGDHYGSTLISLVPEFEALFAEFSRPDKTELTTELTLKIGSHVRIFTVHILPDYKDNVLEGYVVTFDDVTNLLSAQKKAAWSDVARQIAHEIKNPLTPISLATDRLCQKFLPQIQTGATQFKEYTETILKYVDQIRTLINEFSNFARMPEPRMQLTNITPICEKIVRLQQVAYPKIQFQEKMPDGKILLDLDQNQLMQAVTNILKNSIEAVADNPTPKINLTIEKSAQSIAIITEDNGKGLPEGIPVSQLVKPYITREKNGTGLGLAIVQKIMEDHQGQLTLERSSEGGTIVKLMFPQAVKKNYTHGL